jgi:hypothetical protein
MVIKETLGPTIWIVLGNNIIDLITVTFHVIKYIDMDNYVLRKDFYVNIHILYI